jgi:hypothetical protein
MESFTTKGITTIELVDRSHRPDELTTVAALGLALISGFVRVEFGLSEHRHLLGALPSSELRAGVDVRQGR